jgi:hypothetical protein
MSKPELKGQRSIPPAPTSYMDPEILLIKYKRKTGIILDALKSIQQSQKEDVDDFISTIESVLPIINRILTQINKVGKPELELISSKLQSILDEYEEKVTKLEKTGKIRRLLSSNRVRKKLENINSELASSIEQFVGIIIQIEAQAYEREQEEEKKNQTMHIQRLASQFKSQSLRTTKPSSVVETNNNFGQGDTGKEPVEEELNIEKLLTQPFLIPQSEIDVARMRYCSFLPRVQLTPDLFKDEWDVFFGEVNYFFWTFKFSLYSFNRKSTSILMSL